MLRWSDRAQSVRPIFFYPHNEITFVVEDRYDEEFYTNLFKSVFSGSLRINKVVGVGGKSAVIKRFEQQRTNKHSKKEYYVVDGDFDELLDVPAISDEFFYRLPRYDIEGFLLEEIALCHVAREQTPKRGISEYSDSFEFDIWLNQIIELITELVACNALLHQIRVSHASGIDRFILPGSIFPDPVEIKNYVETMRSGQSTLSFEEFDSRIEALTQRMGPSLTERTRWVSGKNILLPLAIRLLRRETQKSIALDSLRFRLSNYCELSSLDEFRDRVLDALGKK